MIGKFEDKIIKKIEGILYQRVEMKLKDIEKKTCGQDHRKARFYLCFQY